MVSNPMSPKITHILASKFKLLTNTSLHSIDLLKGLMVFSPWCFQHSFVLTGSFLLTGSFVLMGSLVLQEQIFTVSECMHVNYHTLC